MVFLLTERPDVLPFSFPIEVKEGQPLQVPCTIMSGDEPITIQWHKDGLPLSSSPKLMINTVTSRMSMLIIQGASSDHSGTYSCKAFNPVGQTGYSASLEVMGNLIRRFGMHQFPIDLCTLCFVLMIALFVFPVDHPE